MVATRAAIDLLSKTRQLAELPAAITESLLSSDDPELSVIRGENRAAVAVALEAALVRLSTRHKTILRLHIVDGLTAAGIAAVYRVHRATAFRWLAEIKRFVLEELQHSVGRLLELSPSSLRSLTFLYRNDLQLSISRVLPPSGPVETGPL